MKILYCLLYCGLLGILSFLLGRILPKSWFSAERFPYRSLPFEKNGKFYERFGIRKWQNRVPDMSKWFPKLMPAKKVTADFEAQLPVMIQETCIAEFIHSLLCVAGLYCLKLWPGVGGVVFTLIYILIGNVPYILIQRYNRPRFCKLQARVHRNQKHEEVSAANGNVDFKLQYRTGA